MSAGTGDCDQVREALGAYALDAVEADEAEVIAAHLATCPRCRQDFDQYQETVGLYASAGGAAPPGVWEQISAAIDADRGPAETPEPPRLQPLSGPRRRRPNGKTLGALAAAAAVVAAVVMIGVQTNRVDHLNSQVHRLGVAARQAAGTPSLAEALVDPTATHLTLTSTAVGARPLGQLIIMPSGSAYLVGSHLADLPRTETYQLWSVISGRAISVAVLGSHPAAAPFSVDPSVVATAYMVTVEPAGGVVAPTASPVAQALR